MASILSQEDKIKIAEKWFTARFTKTQLADDFCVSTRTIGRAIDFVVTNGLLEETVPGDSAEIEEVETEKASYEYNFMASKEAITITRIGEDEINSSVVYNDQPNFEEVSEIIWNSRGEQSELERAFNISSVKQYLETYTNGAITVYPEENRVTYKLEGSDKEYDFTGKLVSRLMEDIRAGGAQGVQGLTNFANRLALNPSNRAVSELYEFLEATDIKINQDGMVECYKKVREDYKDCYTGSIDNSVGEVVSVPRNLVDEDSEVTCSHGLHVCSYAYLSSYPGKVILKVLVDPADFVSIPKDYYSLDGNGEVKAKARVCKYIVDREVTEEYSRFSF